MHGPPRLAVPALLVGVVAAALVAAGCAPSSEEQSAPPGHRAVAPDAAGGGAGGAAPEVGGEAGAEMGAANLDAIAAARMIVRNAEVELVVRDGSAAFTSIRALAQRVGGFVANANLTQPEGSPPARLGGTVVMRVPAERLDAVLAELGRLAVETPTTRISTQDVTEQVVDLDARLANLRLLEAELQALLAEVREAGNRSVDQLFSVFERIRQVRDQIEQLEGRKRALEQQLALSTVTVQLVPRPDPVGSAGPWQPGAVVERAAATLFGALRVVGSVVIWLAVFALPLALVLMLPFALALAAWRWRRRSPTPAA